MMKEKIIDYIEQLEAKAYQSDTYFKERNELYISNQEKDKEIERLNNIIKDVREYINKAINEGYDYQEKDNLLFESLEILDKENI